jgi:hypothetical protein
MNEKIKTAVLVGLGLGVLLIITGVLGAYLPFLGCCNCLWPIGAGILAVWMYVNKSPVRVTPGDGAMMGALAALVGGLLYCVIGVPLSYMLNSAAMEAQLDQLRNQGIQIPDFGLVVFVIVSGVLFFIIGIIMGLIGGLIGVPIFERRKGGPGAPPPPPGFGGPQGGTYPPPPENYGPGGYGPGV